MFFGSWGITPGEASEFEQEVGEQMMDLLAAFVRDPMNGLSDAGWPVYDTDAGDGGTVARFGADGQAVQYVSGNSPSVEGACYVDGVTLDTTP